MEKKSKKGILVGITSLVLIMLLLVGLTYAYYRTRVIGNQSTDPSISVTSEKMEIVYEDGSAYFSTEGKIEPGFEYSKRFTVKNTGDTAVGFSIVLENFVNEFMRNEDWELSIVANDQEVRTTYDANEDGVVDENDTIITSVDVVFPMTLPNHPTDKLIFANQEELSIEAGKSITFTLYLTYKNLTNVNQSVDMGKNLSFKINIDEPVAEKEGYALTSASYTSSALQSTIENNIDNNNYYGKFYLTQDTVLEEGTILTSLEHVTLELDLNGYTLTLKDYLHYDGWGNLTIKNGTIKRDSSFTNGVMISVISRGNVLLEDLRIDGMNVETSFVSDSVLNFGMAFRADARSASFYKLTFDNCYIVNHIGTENHRGRVVQINGLNDVVVKSTTVADNISTNGQMFMVENSRSLLFDEKSVIKNNVSASSSGLDVRDTNATIAGTIINNKTTLADGNGGGLYTLLQSTDKTVTITSTAKINNNESAAGGGVYVNAGKNDTPVGKVIIEGGEIKGNVATATPAEGTYKDGGGAGIYVARGDLEINGGTIENNNSTCGIGHAILVSNAGGNINGGKLTINGGTVLGTIFAAPNYSQFVVNGGTFDTDISAYLGASHTVQNSNGKYIVS